MEQRWYLTDLDQTAPVELTDRRPGAKVGGGVNRGRSASCEISLEDEAVDSLSAQDKLLKVAVEGWTQPLFVGRVVVPEGDSQADSEGYVINALDPWAQLETSFHKGTQGADIFGLDTFGPTYYAAADQAAIMWDLIEDLDVAHGIIVGTLAGGSVNRNRAYLPGKNIAEAVLQMAEVIGGPDFELAPVAATNGDLAEFNTYHPQQGSDLSGSVIFYHRHGDQTALAFAPSDSGELLCNRCIAVGQELVDGEGSGNGYHIAVIAEHASSISTYGIFEEVLAFGDVSIATTLEEHAEAHVAASAVPIPYFDFDAGPDGPVFAPSAEGGDFWQGDTISVSALLPRAESPQTYSGRVTDWELTEQENGDVIPSFTCQPEVDSAGVNTETVVWYMPSDVETE